MSNLDLVEKEILEAFESGKLKKSRNAKKKIEQHKAVADATVKEDAQLAAKLADK
jgi:hypothetical protein